MLSFRKLHSNLGLALSIPLLVCAVTGGLWCIQKRWMGISKPDKWLMKWHQGDAFFGFLDTETYVSHFFIFKISHSHLFHKLDIHTPFMLLHILILLTYSFTRSLSINKAT